MHHVIPTSLLRQLTQSRRCLESRRISELIDLALYSFMHVVFRPLHSFIRGECVRSGKLAVAEATALLMDVYSGNYIAVLRTFPTASFYLYTYHTTLVCYIVSLYIGSGVFQVPQISRRYADLTNRQCDSRKTRLTRKD